MNAITKALDRIDTILAYIAGFFVLVMMVMVFLDSALRTTLNKPLVGTIEFTGEYLLPIIVYFSISYTLKHNSHVSVDFLKHLFPKWLDKIFRVFYNLIALVIFVIMGMNNFSQGLQYIERDVRSVGMLDYPLAPALFIISLGILLLSVRLLVETINLFRKEEKDA